MAVFFLICFFLGIKLLLTTWHQMDMQGPYLNFRRRRKWYVVNKKRYIVVFKQLINNELLEVWSMDLLKVLLMLSIKS